MEKLRNNLFLASVRSRQSSLYRAQQLAEFTLYDNDPELFNTDLQNLSGRDRGTNSRFSCAISRHGRPRAAGHRAGPQETPQASPQEPGDPDQPTSPLPQIPAPPDEAPPGSSIPTTSQPADRIELIRSIDNRKANEMMQTETFRREMPPPLAPAAVESS